MIKPIAFLLLLCLATLAPPTAQANDIGRILRENLASKNGDAVILQPEPEASRIISPGAVIFDVAKRLPPGTIGGVTADIEAKGPGELELVAIYSNSTSFVVPRRALQPGASTIRWEVPNSDTLTSYTLSVRGEAPATIKAARAEDFSTVPLRDQFLASVENPISIPHIPNAEDKAVFRVHYPDHLRGQLFDKILELEFAANGESMKRILPVDLKTPKGAEGKIAVQDFEFSIPPGTASGVATLRIGGEEISHLSMDLTPIVGPSFEVPDRSIEDFAVLERNGEVAIYALAGDEGLSRGLSGAPLPADLIWLAAGNGERWPVSEPMLRSNRGNEWLNGGPTAMGAGRIAGYQFGAFTTVSSSGVESLSITFGINSLRLAAYAKNPVWVPGDKRDADAPLWRGNAFFDMNGGRMIIGLQREPAGESFARVLVSPQEARWVDLGALPLPGLDNEARWMSGFKNGEQFILLAGPKLQLFSSDNALRGWKQGSITTPAGWEKMQILRWADKLWLFGIARNNGRGFVTWRQLSASGNDYRVTDETKFVAPPPPARVDNATPQKPKATN